MITLLENKHTIKCNDKELQLIMVAISVASYSQEVSLLERKQLAEMWEYLHDVTGKLG